MLMWNSGIRTKLGKMKGFIKLSFFLFIPFFFLYLFCSTLLSQTSAFSEWNLLFGLDTPRVIGDMAVFYSNHYRTNVHPLYVILVNPIGDLISHLIHSDLRTALFLNSFFGASGVILGFAFLWLYQRKSIPALLLACLFGFSTSQFLLSTIPDTASLAICSLIATYIVFFISLRKQISLLWWILVGLFSLAITTTNFIQNLIFFSTYLVATSQNKKVTNILKWIFIYCGLVLLLAVPLALLQKAIYPSAGLFFLPKAYNEEFDYISTLILKEPLIVVFQIIRSFLSDNIVAPYPKIIRIEGVVNPVITFSNSWNYSTLGWVALCLWGILLVLGIVHILRNSVKTISEFGPWRSPRGEKALVN